MQYTPLIQKAIRFATQVHEIDQKQKRKGKDIPYITHPLSVGLVLARANASESVIVAGILHDTIEDSAEGHKVTQEAISEVFGADISQLVASVTETRKDLPWDERKQEALRHIQEFSHDSLLLKSADILANASELLDDHASGGDAVFSRFNAPKEKIIGHYIQAIDAIIEKWPESPLATDLVNLMDQLIQIGAPEVKQYASPDLYFDEETQKVRKIVFVSCEDEEGCKFLVEFSYPNCTFFFCKEHKMGFNLDLSTVPKEGVECKQHGKMERYDVWSEDNLCPSCRNNTLAILSVGR